MKKKMMTKLLFGGAALLALTLAANNVGAWGSNNKWNDKMVKPADPNDKNKSSTNISSGKVTKPDGSAGGSEAPAAGDLLAYGEGTLHCRDAVLKLNSNFESGAGTGTSEIKVTELGHGATKVVSCASVTPTLVNNTGNAVNGGTITIRCGNGQLHVAASNCTAPTPTPTPPPTDPGTGGTAPGTDPGTGTGTAPAGPPPGYGTAACGSYCSDTTLSCTRTGSKNGGSVTTYKTCQNGQVYFTASGKCGAAPTNCQ